MNQNQTNLTGLRFVGVGMSFIAARFNSLPPTMTALLLLMVIDFCAGILVAYTRHHWSKEKSIRGATRKVMVLLIIGMSAIPEIYLRRSMNLPEGQSLHLSEGVGFFYCCHYFISVLQNAVKLGLPVPPQLRDFLQNLDGADPSVARMFTKRSQTVHHVSPNQPAALPNQPAASGIQLPGDKGADSGGPDV